MTLETSGSLRISVVGDKKWRDRVKRADNDIQTGVERAIERGLLLLKGEIQRRISGQGSDLFKGKKRAGRRRKRIASALPASGAGGVVLNKRTGTLFRSIHSRLRRAGADSSGEVGTPIIYAKTHELGLTITYPSRGISIQFPKRPFVEPSLDAYRNEIVTSIRRALNKAVRA